MIRDITISLTPAQAAETAKLKAYVAKNFNIPEEQPFGIDILKKSVDARQKGIKIIFQLRLYISEQKPSQIPFLIKYKKLLKEKSVIIIGAGPAGLFAALKCIENSIKPVILERGKAVSERKPDIAAINRPSSAHLVNKNSNYCFGEGGAGTFSDGKLYTRSNKKGDVKNILQILIAHGADPGIAYEAHPHIGSDKLPQIIANIRETIINAGGEIHFNTEVVDLEIENNVIRSVVTAEGKNFTGNSYILACGHSAHDTYEMLIAKGIHFESKAFAVGVRVEHPQELINKIQYKTDADSKYLPPAAYKLVTQVNGRGVFSFCMCPGGIIVPAASKPGELVLNGMSNSKRNSPYANAGIVVTINPAELTDYEKYGIMAGLEFQKRIERKCFEAAGSNNMAPAQRMTDFCQNKVSEKLNKTSYNPGTINLPIHEILPDIIVSSLQKAFIEFGKKMKGFYTEEAMILAPESRTSSPIRIPRQPDKFSCPDINNLYPCGEGAGYAGGITSSAIDGENCANAVVKDL